MSKLDRPLLTSRRRMLRALAAVPLAGLSLAGLVTQGGCVGRASGAIGPAPDLVWGRRGLSEGRLLKPRAIAIDRQDRLYLVDTTGRIQVFDADGNYLHGWKMPETEYGRPTGLAVSPQDHLLVADTHYFRTLTFTLEGQWVEQATIGGVAGSRPGQFAFVTDAVRDTAGTYYIGEYGESDRIQRFDADGNFIDSWGGTGREPGKFVRPQSLVLSARESELWVADACNHRIQVFDVRDSPPRLLDVWGREGAAAGQMYYPYDLVIADDGTLYVCEYGNQRVQHFDRSGRSLGIIGRPGHGPGEFYQPWGLVIDSQHRMHVLDSNNHRVQRFDLS